MYIKPSVAPGDLPPELLLIAPLFALSTSVIVSFAAGTVFLCLMVLTAISVSTLRRFIIWQIRLPFLILIIATWATLFDMGLTAYFYDLRNQMGIYLPLLAFNSLVFAASEEYFLKNSAGKSLIHAIKYGLIILLIFIVAGIIRELLIYGSLFRDSGLIRSGTEISLVLVDYGRYSGFSILHVAPGAFICLGLIFGLLKYFTTPAGKVMAEKQSIE